jgi:hypothetical protein
VAAYGGSHHGFLGDAGGLVNPIGSIGSGGDAQHGATMDSQVAMDEESDGGPMNIDVMVLSANLHLILVVAAKTMFVGVVSLSRLC